MAGFPILFHDAEQGRRELGGVAGPDHRPELAHGLRQAPRIGHYHRDAMGERFDRGVPQVLPRQRRNRQNVDPLRTSGSCRKPSRRR